jgi:hypothetical protein
MHQEEVPDDHHLAMSTNAKSCPPTFALYYHSLTNIDRNFH